MDFIEKLHQNYNAMVKRVMENIEEAKQFIGKTYYLKNGAYLFIEGVTADGYIRVKHVGIDDLFITSNIKTYILLDNEGNWYFSLASGEETIRYNLRDFV